MFWFKIISNKQFLKIPIVVLILSIYILSDLKERAKEPKEGVLKFISFSCKCVTFNIPGLEYYKENICMSLLLQEKNLI